MSGGRHISPIEPGSRPCAEASFPSPIGPANPVVPEWLAAGLGVLILRLSHSASSQEVLARPELHLKTVPA